MPNGLQDDVVSVLPLPPAENTGAEHRTVIVPPSGWQLINFAELWKYRELLFFFVWRDVKVRYKQTALGAAWAVIQPTMTMVVFTIVFGRVAKLPTGNIDGPLFYLSGLLPWFYFASALSAASTSVLGSERLITKIYFPRLAIPFSALGASTVDFLISCGLLGLFCLYYGVAPTWQLAVAPLVVAIIALFAVGLGTLLAALNVSYRDFRYLVPFIVQIGMYATPTIYLQPDGTEGSTVSLLLQLNPMTSLVAAFRAAVLGGDVPWVGVAAAGVCSVVTFIFGCLYFRKVEDRFADLI